MSALIDFIKDNAVSFLSGGAAGAIINQLSVKYGHRIQKMKCVYLKDEVLSSIPLLVNDEPANNEYDKCFEIKNTTNKDWDSLTIMFQFDVSSKVIECYSSSKEGTNFHKVKVDKNNPYLAKTDIKHFNRGDAVKYHFRLIDVDQNGYHVIVTGVSGVKIVYEDKRIASKTVSNASPVSMVDFRE